MKIIDWSEIPIEFTGTTKWSRNQLITEPNQVTVPNIPKLLMSVFKLGEKWSKMK